MIPEFVVYRAYMLLSSLILVKDFNYPTAINSTLRNTIQLEWSVYPEDELGECFESVYLGVNINPDEKSKIISVARNLNPNINVYQMTIDTNAFKLNDKLI